MTRLPPSLRPRGHLAHDHRTHGEPVRRCLDCGAKAQRRTKTCWACGSPASVLGEAGDKDVLFSRFGNTLLEALIREGFSPRGAWLCLMAQMEWAKLVQRVSEDPIEGRIATKYLLTKLTQPGVPLGKRRIDDDVCFWT